MITGSQEYEQFLAGLANTAPSGIKMRLPINEPVYEIDLNTRKVSAPPFIGVEGDHQAEYIFFEMDRYYDMIDLSSAVGLVIFKNAKNEEYCQLIPYYDIDSKKGKIIFPWVIQAPAASYSGTVSFSFKFYKVNPTFLPSLPISDDTNHREQILLYEINTTVAKTKVLNGWANGNGVDHTYQTLSPESIIIDNDLLEKLNLILSSARYNKIYWLDIDELIERGIDIEAYNDALGLL